MKHFNFIIIFLFIFFNEIQAQDIFSSTPTNDVQTVTEGIFPETNTISLGGQEKTAGGVYIYRITAMKDGKILFNESRQMLLIK